MDLATQLTLATRSEYTMKTCKPERWHKDTLVLTEDGRKESGACRGVSPSWPNYSMVSWMKPKEKQSDHSRKEPAGMGRCCCQDFVRRADFRPSRA
ncbi:uncharacterized protein MYCFIDRAFT_180836, partial [Pseudocercospora fijiensis CIRAD86]